MRLSNLKRRILELKDENKKIDFQKTEERVFLAEVDVEEMLGQSQL